MYGRLVALTCACVLGWFVFAATAHAYDFGGADDLFAERSAGVAAVDQASAAYQEALSASLTNEETAYATAQSARLQALKYRLFAGDKNAQKKIGKTCLAHTEAATPERIGETPQYYYWRALCRLLWAKANGVFASLKYAGEVEELALKGVELDATYEGGGAHRLLGILYHKLPSINPYPGGPVRDLEASFAHFRAAENTDAYVDPIDASWRDPFTETGDYHYELYFYKAEAHIVADEKAVAKETLQRAIARIEEEDDLPVGREPETEAILVMMQELLGSL